MAKEPNPILDVAKLTSRFIPGVSEAVTAYETLTESAQGAYSTFVKGIQTIESYRISLTKASGASSAFVEGLRKETYSLNQYGIGLEKVVAANVAMAESFSKATFSAAQTRLQFEADREAMQKLITVNEKFGLSQGETISLANKLTNSVFNNISSFQKFSDTLLKFATETGQPFNKVMQDFGTYSDRFISNLSSDKAIQSFTTLQTLARRAGMSIDSLVGSLNKFDDVEEAFASGGQINRVLSYFGGSLDTLAMARASEEEQAKMLLEAISGISEQFNTQMTDPRARKAVLKELVSATGIPIEQVMGLLNQNNDLSRDLQSIIRTPSVTRMEEMPEQQKAKMAMDLTSQAEVDKIKMENMLIGPFTMALERFNANQKSLTIDFSREFSREMDKGISMLLKKGDVPGALEQFGKAFSEAKDVITNTSGFKQFQAALSGNGGLTEIMSTTGDIIKRNISFLDSDKYYQDLNRHTENLSRINQRRIQEESKGLEEAVGRGVGKLKGDVQVSVTLKDSSGKPIPGGRVDAAARILPEPTSATGAA